MEKNLEPPEDEVPKEEVQEEIEEITQDVEVLGIKEKLEKIKELKNLRSFVVENLDLNSKDVAAAIEKEIEKDDLLYVFGQNNFEDETMEAEDFKKIEDYSNEQLEKSLIFFRLEKARIEDAKKVAKEMKEIKKITNELKEKPMTDDEEAELNLLAETIEELEKDSKNSEKTSEEIAVMADEAMKAKKQRLKKEIDDMTK